MHLGERPTRFSGIGRAEEQRIGDGEVAKRVKVAQPAQDLDAQRRLAAACRSIASTFRHGVS